MISAIVLTPDGWTGDDLVREREVVVRSLVWLVSAVVASVVRDVTLAVPAGLGLGDLADQSGCALVQADTEAERLAAAVAVAREERLIVLRAGFQPDAGLIEELDVVVRRSGADPQSDMQAVLLSTPISMMQRLFPQRAEPAGCLVPRQVAARAKGGVDRMFRDARRHGTILAARARPII